MCVLCYAAYYYYGLKSTNVENDKKKKNQVKINQPPKKQSLAIYQQKCYKRGERKLTKKKKR